MLATPSDFGGYRVERELGRGGMGGVYLAVDKMLERPVALKVMQKSFGDDPEFVARFQREAQSAARLNNAHVVQVYAFGRTEGIPYIAMEFVGNGSLQQEIKCHPQGMDPVRVAQVGRQVAEALACAAAHGLVHGDVKPENVLYAEDGTAKLADFGLAAMQNSQREIWGTPYYISPEKVRSQTVDFRADLYSLGGTLYHALTGIPPFDHSDPIELMKLRLRETPRWPSFVRAGVPPEIDVIVMRLLQTEPAMRYVSCEALLEDLDAFLVQHVPPKKTDAKATAKRPVPVKIVKPATVKLAKSAPMVEVSPVKSANPPTEKSVVLRHVKKDELFSGMARKPVRERLMQSGPMPSSATRTPQQSALTGARQKHGGGCGHAIATFFLFLLLLSGVAGAVWWFYFRQQTPAASVPQMPPRTGSGEVKIIKTS